MERKKYEKKIRVRRTILLLLLFLAIGCRQTSDSTRTHELTVPSVPKVDRDLTDQSVSTDKKNSDTLYPTIHLTADQYTVPPETPVTLSWNVENSSDCKASEDWSGALPAKGSKIITNLKSRNFFALECKNSVGSASNFISVYIESVPSLRPPSSLGKVKSLRSLIVFANSGESLPLSVKNDFCKTQGVNSLASLSEWFVREATRYDILLTMKVDCYDQQVVLPPEVIATTGTYTAFGQQILMPLDLTKTEDYVMNKIPLVGQYDLVTVIFYRTAGAAVADLANINKKMNFVFLTKGVLIEGKQSYVPHINESGRFLKSIAHESLHSLGALDHYDYSNPGLCMTETDKEIQFDSQRIMCGTPMDNFKGAVIPLETAKEIGWVDK